MKNTFRLLGLAAVVVLGQGVGFGGWPLPQSGADTASLWGAAFAQDDDDDGDDDDDDRPPSPPRSNAPKPAPVVKPAVTEVTPGPSGPDPVARTAPQKSTAPPAVSAPDEIVVIGLSDADLARLLAEGFVVLDVYFLPGLAPVQTDQPGIDPMVAPINSLALQRLAVPKGLSLDAARDRVRALPSGQSADFNHYYRAEQGSAVQPPPCEGPHCVAFAQVGWSVSLRRAQSCAAPVVPPDPAAPRTSVLIPLRLGMIDTALNADHSTFAGADLIVLPLTPPNGPLAASPETIIPAALTVDPPPDRGPSPDPSSKLHGTAVAALLIGDPAGRSPGLVPALPLLAIDAFHNASGDERADLASLIVALDQLAGAGARVINLSLAGPPNAVLQEAVTRLIRDQGIILVTAAGNGGPSAPPAYPAAYAPDLPGLIAVTAVDSADRVYRRAAQGPHIGLAAPGVEVWTAASVKGARSKSGTSFAAPFVTAAAALLLQGNPALTPAEVADRLKRGARDLGAPGPDPVFGHGLVQLAGLCPPVAP